MTDPPRKRTTSFHDSHIKHLDVEIPCPFATSFQLFYGSLGEAIALTATAPLQRCQWTVQVLVPSLDVKTCSQHILQQSNGPYPWTLFWKGNILSIGYVSLQKALQLVLHDYGMEHYALPLSGHQLPKDKKQPLTDEQRVIKLQVQRKCMLWSQMASMVILYPLSFALTHFVIIATEEQMKEASGVISLWRQTIQNVGGFAIFRGMGMMLSNFLLSYHLAEFILGRLRRFGPLKHRNLQSILAKTIAGCFAYPLETLGRRLQIGVVTVPSSSESTIPSTTHALFAGVGVCSIKNITYHGILEVFYSGLVSDLFRKFAMRFFH